MRAAYEADLIIGAIHLRSFLRNDDDDDNDEMRRTRIEMRERENAKVYDDVLLLLMMIEE